MFDDICWCATCKLPAFKAFKCGGSRRFIFDIEFEVGEEGAMPSKRAVTVAQRVIDNQEKLVTKIANALWNDFAGKGPNTGMWWHGDLNAVSDNIALGMGFGETVFLESVVDVFGIIGLPAVYIRENMYNYEKPIAEIGFYAAFEDEHGLGVLTN